MNKKTAALSKILQKRSNEDLKKDFVQGCASVDTSGGESENLVRPVRTPPQKYGSGGYGRR
jgi:hypothetical protein